MTNPIIVDPNRYKDIRCLKTHESSYQGWKVSDIYQDLENASIKTEQLDMLTTTQKIVFLIPTGMCFLGVATPLTIVSIVTGDPLPGIYGGISTVFTFFGSFIALERWEKSEDSRKSVRQLNKEIKKLTENNSEQVIPYSILSQFLKIDNLPFFKGNRFYEVLKDECNFEQLFILYQAWPQDKFTEYISTITHSELKLAWIILTRMHEYEPDEIKNHLINGTINILVNNNGPLFLELFIRNLTKTHLESADVMDALYKHIPFDWDSVYEFSFLTQEEKNLMIQSLIKIIQQGEKFDEAETFLINEASKLKEEKLNPEEGSETLTFDVNGTTFSISKKLLIEKSEYFKTLLSQKFEEKEKSDIDLIGIFSFEEVKEMIHFLETGKLRLDNELTHEFYLELGHKFGIDSLVSECENDLLLNQFENGEKDLNDAFSLPLEEFKNSNYIQSIKLAKEYSLKKLMKKMFTNLVQYCDKMTSMDFSSGKNFTNKILYAMNKFPDHSIKEKETLKKQLLKHLIYAATGTDIKIVWETINLERNPFEKRLCLKFAKQKQIELATAFNGKLPQEISSFLSIHI